MSSFESKFGAADRSQWLALVTAALKNVPADQLCRRDEDDLEINALYDIQPDAMDAIAASASRLPMDPAAYLAYGWDICQPVTATARPQHVNRLILDELENGAGSIWLHDIPDDLAQALPEMMQGIMLKAAGIYLDAGNGVMAHMAAFSAFCKTQDTALSALRFGANIDPFGPAMDPCLLERGVAYFNTASPEDRPAGLFRPNGWHWHNRGMTTVQELAYLLASLTQILRRGAAAGLDLADLARHVSVTIALPADLSDGIAKCRALRQCWAGITQTIGLDPAAQRLFIHGFVSLRMFSVLDCEVNMLRTTTALLGGAIGGADQISAHPHDCLSADIGEYDGINNGSAEGRRLAQMQQHLMIEESGLSHSFDPAGGAGFIEGRSASLAAAAWGLFQEIEADGGAAVFAADAGFARFAQNSAMKRFARMAAGDLALVGVNIQPDSRPVAPVAAKWAHLRRPAAAVEVIRVKGRDIAPRILTLQVATIPDPRRDKLRAMLAVGGMQCVHMSLDDTDAVSIAAARPDVVILIDCSFDMLNPDVASSLLRLQAAGKIYLADQLINGATPLDDLASFVGLSLDCYRKGDA